MARPGNGQNAKVIRCLKESAEYCPRFASHAIAIVLSLAFAWQIPYLLLPGGASYPSLPDTASLPLEARDAPDFQQSAMRLSGVQISGHL